MDSMDRDRTVEAAQVPLVPLDEGAQSQIAALAARQMRATSLLMQVVTFVGGQVEDGLKLLPRSGRDRIEGAARRALRHSYDMAARSRGRRVLNSDRAHRALCTLSGAVGGVGGLPTALAELPMATTVIFRAVQGVAEIHGEDPTDPETRMEVLRVFGAGGPGEADDGIDTAFIGARLSLSGAALNRLIGAVAPRFAAMLGQKLATQTIPILGAAAGAGTNYAFIDYYIELAHVHFGLRRLTRRHDAALVHDAFHVQLAQLKLAG